MNPSKPSLVKHILIIRPGAIGDTLLSFPILEALRAQHTNPHLTLISNVNVLPLALEFDLAEAVSDYGAKQWSELFSTAGIQTPSLLELLGYIDLTICWLRDPDGLVERNLRMAGVKQVIVAPGRPPADKRIHIVEYLAETVGLRNEGQLAQLAGLTQLSAPCFSILRPPARLISYSRYIAIHPGSGSAHKCWPPSHFAAVIEQLWQRNYPVLLLSGPADQQRVEEILGLLPIDRPEKWRILENVPLLEVARHLQQCRCYLGNDSGITHLAALLGIPTIALFGPSDPIVWRPSGRAVTIIQECPLERLNIEVVVDTIDAICQGGESEPIVLLEGSTSEGCSSDMLYR